MSAYSPPIYYFSGIQFNSSFFVSSNSSLTQTQASKLYLLKNTADIATALESFTGGILTNNIQALTATGDLSIYPSQTSGNMYIGVNSTSSTGRTGTVHIADGNNMPAGATVHINNGTSNACNTNIMNGATTSGTCNIMTGATSSGIVNIVSGTGASQSSIVNIGTGNTTGTLTLGNSNNTVQINGGLTMGIGKNITLQPASGNVAPTSGQLGYIEKTTISTSIGMANNTPLFIQSITVPAGTSIIFCNVKINISSGSTATNIAIYLNNSGFGTTAVSPLSNTGTLVYINNPYSITFNYVVYNFSIPINVLSSTTFNLYSLGTFSGNVQYLSDYFNLSYVKIG